MRQWLPFLVDSNSFFSGSRWLDQRVIWAVSSAMTETAGHPCLETLQNRALAVFGESQNLGIMHQTTTTNMMFFAHQNWIVTPTKMGRSWLTASHKNTNGQNFLLPTPWAACVTPAGQQLKKPQQRWKPDELCSHALFRLSTHTHTYIYIYYRDPCVCVCDTCYINQNRSRKQLIRLQPLTILEHLQRDLCSFPRNPSHWGPLPSCKHHV